MRCLLAAVILLTPMASLAQSHQPYAGLQMRVIKALSPEQIADLRNGRGMGLALAAELNHYPGPLHVLELAEKLQLSSAQKSEIEQLFREMKSEAIALGERVISAEAALDRQFAARSVSAESLASATAAIGDAQGALRAAHLKYHLKTRDLLNEGQIARYAELRGYGAGGHLHRPRH